MKERDLVQQVYDGLTLKGYIVMRANQWRGDRAGSDKGCPDAFVTHPSWENRWIGLEFKTPTGRLSREQQWLLGHNAVVIIRSWEEALAVVEAYRHERSRG